MSHNRSHIIIRLVVAAGVASMGLIALPGVAQAATAVSAAPTAKTAPGQPKFGEKGAHVVAVQTAIMRNGFTLKGGATGVFDNTTLKAIKTFQKVVGIKVTGVVDVDTARVLKVAAATTTTVAATTTAAPTTTVAPTTTLPAVQYPFTAQNLPVRGNKGDNVLLVQKALSAAGIAVKGGIDGMFGSGTTASLSAFQTAKGLPVSGVLDAATAAALNLIAPIAAPTTTIAPPTVSAAAVSTPLTTLPVRGNKGDSVLLVQKALVAAGIEVKGGLDGVFGGATFVALQKFQAAKGIAVTGTVDVATAIKLNLMAAPAIQLAVFPIQGVCSFENTWHAPRGGGRQHLGVDIIAKEGNLEYAVADGTITKIYTVGTDKLAGNGIRLTTADGTYFFYGHMNRLADGIAIGAKVKAGQVVGYNGKTGDTNTPHLHFEVHPQGGEAVDPTSIVAAIDGCKNTTPLVVPAG